MNVYFFEMAVNRFDSLCNKYTTSFQWHVSDIMRCIIYSCVHVCEGAHIIFTIFLAS